VSSIFKLFIKYIFIIFIVYSDSFAITIENEFHAVDVAGKQRMFTQRMLKDYSMMGMNNSFGNSSKDLKEIMSEFENHLESLYKYTKSKKIRKKIKKAKKVWIPIKKTLQTKPDKGHVAKLQESLDELLSLSNDITNLFAKETGKKSGEIVDMSGRQRMLSQRMASLYMLKVWGVNDKEFKEKMNSAMTLFKNSLKTLQKSKLNTDEINKLLNEVEKSFTFFEIMNKSDTAFIPALIYKKSNDILKNMDRVTKCYVDVTKEKK
jgi:nucleoside-triphosphatase THEP1